MSQMESGTEHASGFATSRAEWVAFAVASLLLVASLWIVDYLPTHDGPQHVFLAYLNNHYSDEGRNYSFYYDQGRALTSLGFNLLFGMAELVFDWRVALQIVLSIIVLVWAWGGRTMVAAIHRERSVMGLVAFGLALQWSLYMGFFSYVLATGLGFWVLAYGIRASRWGWKERGVLAGMLLVQAIAHVFAAQVTGLLLLLLMLFRTERRRWMADVGGVVLLGLPALLIALYTAGVLTDPARAPLFASMDIEWSPLTKRFTRFVDLFVAGPLWRSVPVVLLSVFGFLSAAARWRRLRDVERALLVGGVVLLAACLLMPFHIRGRWEFLAPRFAPTAVMLGLALVPVETVIESRRRRLAGVASGVLTAALLLWSMWFHRAIRGRCDEALAGLDSDLRVNAVRLPIVLDTKCGAWPFLRSQRVQFVEPLLNLGALYAVEQGGIVPYVFALQPEIHPFVLSPLGLRGFPPVPGRKEFWVKAMTSDGLERERTVQHLAWFGSKHHDVILWGTAEDAAVFVSRGFVADVLRGGLLLGHFRGCPTTVEIRSESESPAPIVVDYGWSRGPGRVWGAVVGPPKPDQPTRVALPECPCGAIWLRVVQDRDGSGTVTSADGRCNGADAESILRLDARPELGTITCSLSAP